MARFKIREVLSGKFIRIAVPFISDLKDKIAFIACPLSTMCTLWLQHTELHTLLLFHREVQKENTDIELTKTPMEFCLKAVDKDGTVTRCCTLAPMKNKRLGGRAGLLQVSIDFVPIL